MTGWISSLGFSSIFFETGEDSRGLKEETSLVADMFLASMEAAAAAAAAAVTARTDSGLGLTGDETERERARFLRMTGSEREEAADTPVTAETGRE